MIVLKDDRHLRLPGRELHGMSPAYAGLAMTVHINLGLSRLRLPGCEIHSTDRERRARNDRSDHERAVGMDILLNPNVAYLLLVSGFVLAILALLAPGTGVLEILALFTLLLAGYSVYYLPINIWALILLGVGAVAFVLALRRSRRMIYQVISILALVIGSSFLFRGEGWLPAVDPLLALVVSIVTAGSFWFIGRKAIESEQIRPTHDLERLIGEVGEARTDISMEGSVQLEGELWAARSEKLIPNGSKVRIIGREGFILEVEKLEP